MGTPAMAHLLPLDRSEATPQLPATAQADQPNSATAVSTTPHRDRESRMWPVVRLSLIHISEPTRQAEISYAVFCLKKKKKKRKKEKKKKKEKKEKEGERREERE